MFGYSNLGSATAGVTPAPFLSVVAYKGSLETSLCFPKQWKCKLRMSALYPKIRFWNHLAFHSGSVTTWRLAVVSHDERQAEFPSSYSDLSTNECFIPKLHNICVICSAFQLQRAWKNINATSQKASVLTAALLMGKWRRAWVWLGAAGARCARTGSGWQQGRGQPLEPARNCWAIPWNAWTCHISDLFEFIRKFPFQILFFFRIVGSWACREGHFSFLLSCFLNYWVKKLQCKTYVFLLGGGGGGGMLSRICKLNWKKKKKKRHLMSWCCGTVMVQRAWLEGLGEPMELGDPQSLPSAAGGRSRALRGLCNAPSLRSIPHRRCLGCTFLQACINSDVLL